MLSALIIFCRYYYNKVTRKSNWKMPDEVKVMLDFKSNKGLFLALNDMIKKDNILFSLILCFSQNLNIYTFAVAKRDKKEQYSVLLDTLFLIKSNYLYIYSWLVKSTLFRTPLILDPFLVLKHHPRVQMAHLSRHKEL